MHDDLFRIDQFLVSHPDLILPVVPAMVEWSDRLWVTERGTWIAIFRPLNLGIVFFNRHYLASLCANRSDKVEFRLLDQLVKERFIVHRRERADTSDHLKLVAAARRGTFRFICILPTTECSLRCAYCHQRPEKGREQTMTVEEMAAALRACADLGTDGSKPLDILLYGGEPLNAFHITEEIVRLTRPDAGLFQQGLRLSFTTSGVGLLPVQAQFLADHDVFVIVSLDGHPEVNDLARPSPDGSSSFSAGEAAYDLLKEKGARVGLSVTIGRHNIDDLAHHVTFLLERFQPNDIGLNAFLHRRGDRVNPYQVTGEEAFRAFMEAFNVTRQFGVYAEQPFRRLKPFIYRKPLLKDCSAPGERLVLAPGGVMGFCDSCYPDGRYFYSSGDFPQEDHPDYRLWRSLSSPEMPHCRQCPAMTVCGGACRYDAFKASGRLDGVDPERCRFERAFLNSMIWELFDTRTDKTDSYYLPSDEDRLALFGEVSLQPQDQPFTAGSFLDPGRA